MSQALGKLIQTWPSFTGSWTPLDLHTTRYSTSLQLPMLTVLLACSLLIDLIKSLQFLDTAADNTKIHCLLWA